MKRSLKKIALIFAFVFATYVGSYLYLSSNGRYEPIAWDLRGIMWFSWAPEGFFHEPKARWRPAFLYAYFPLLALDWRFWHQNLEPGEKTKYPVDELFLKTKP